MALQIRVGSTPITSAADAASVANNALCWKQPATKTYGIWEPVTGNCSGPLVGRWVTVQVRNVISGHQLGVGMNWCEAGKQIGMRLDMMAAFPCLTLQNLRSSAAWTMGLAEVRVLGVPIIPIPPAPSPPPPPENLVNPVPFNVAFRRPTYYSSIHPSA